MHFKGVDGDPKDIQWTVFTHSPIDTRTDGTWTLFPGILCTLKSYMSQTCSDDSEAMDEMERGVQAESGAVFIHCESEPSNYRWRTARSA